MRILTLPLVGSSERIASESDFLVYRNFHRMGIDNLFSFFLLPKGAEGKVEAISNEKLVFEDMEKSIYTMQSRIPDVMRKFDIVGNRDDNALIEAIVTSRAVSALALSRFYWRAFFRNPPFPVFIVEPKVIDYGSTHNAFVFEELFARSVGYASSYTFFSTPNEKEIAVDQAKRYLSPAMVKRIMQNSMVMPLGINLEEVDKYRKNVPKNEKFTLLFSGRGNSNKNYVAILELFDKFFCLGKNIQIIMMSPLGLKCTDDSDLRKRFPEIKFLSNLPRDEYLKVLCSSHISMNWSKVEGFTVGLIEQIRSGLMVIVPQKPWVKGLFGDEVFKSYPFMFSNETEAFVLIKHAYDNWEAQQGKIEASRKFIDDFEEKSVFIRMFEWMEKIVKTCQEDFGTSASCKELSDEVIKEVGNDFKFADFIKKVEQKSILQNALFYNTNPRFVLTKFDILLYLRRLGYIDNVEYEINLHKDTEEEFV
jgi:glycosyltransferase involved in cell wall biosynthesis